MTLIKADFSPEIILPDHREVQCPGRIDSPLPDDGLPRITPEGIRILSEGMRGDFTRWKWGIGNHPLEMPRDHLRNAVIHAMKDEPHFTVGFWTGNTFPQVKHTSFAPTCSFDRVDTGEIEPGRFDSVEDDPLGHLRWGEIVYLGSDDFWEHFPLAVGSAYLWKRKHEKEERNVCREPRGAGTLEAWFDERGRRMG